MNSLHDVSNLRVQSVSLAFKRYLIDKINWQSRLIGIKGARGTGKTTMLLQWLKMQKLSVTKAIYISLDDLYFLDNNLLSFATDFYQKGGQILVIDEVHKYPRWAQEIKNLYDRYPKLKIIFTGSSIIDIARQEGDLSRRVIMHELPGLSYREFLWFNEIEKLNPVRLDDLLGGEFNVYKYIPEDFKPLQYFMDYLKHGYYPFFKEDIDSYYIKLQQMVRSIVEYDMAELNDFDIRNSKKMLQLLYIMAKQVPFKPNISKLSDKTKIHRNTLPNYFYFLERAKLLINLFPEGKSIALLQKPEKLYLENTNLLNALTDKDPSSGTVRETFFLNQLKTAHKINAAATGDFLVDNQYTFEIGGAGKTRKQVKDKKDAFIVKDDQVTGTWQSLPLWIFGMLY